LLFSSNNSIEIIENDLPLMTFYGTDDIISPINHQEAILSLFRNNTRKEFVNCGHNIFVTQSAVINEMIVAFFNQIQCFEKI
jgi:pimeloyl-ACP methyl ester carboxylesterase